ncbi:DUF5105 domain-containing protein [Vagococcus elongatus]|uniref:DUF5105 domain-containing protein n=1 Tax=Vagococcus elongatus TaxID=180344 RepID=A0A430B3X4_9ENTE|nr:DUF5105 domain-containing protein [Vagococcus elongatus]RSU15035.1 hypothetical protein CBF29_01465 [Vagococcus elongatus]
MKKRLVSLGIIGLLTLVGCGGGNGGGNAGSKSKAGNVEIKEAYFFKPVEADEDADYLILDLKVTNKLSDGVYLYSDKFSLTEKGDDTVIEPLDLGYNSNVKVIEGEVASGKSKTGLISFEIEKDKKYTLNVSLSGVEKDEVIEIALNPNKYEKTKKEFEKTEETAKIFIESAFYQKENEAYDELIGTDKQQVIDIVKKEFNNNMKDYLFSRYHPSDEELEKAFTEYVKQQAERGELNVTLESYYGETAAVKVEFKGINSDVVSSDFNDIESEYRENNDFDFTKAEEYAFNKFNEVYAQADIGEPRDDQFLLMKKKDGKWLFDFKSDDSYENQRFIKIFNGYVN